MKADKTLFREAPKPARGPAAAQGGRPTRKNRAATVLVLLLVGMVAAGARAESKVVVGQAAPEFSVFTPDRKIVNLSDLRGKRVLIFLWASW